MRLQTDTRAIGQSASTSHAVTHAIGLAMYGGLAVAYDKLGFDESWDNLEQEAGKECERMLESLKRVVIENEPNSAKFNWNC